MTDAINTNRQFRLYDADENYMRLSVDETIARELNKWQGWKCSAGVRGLYIDYDGNIWNCNTASSKLDRFNKGEWKKVEFLMKQGDTKPDTSKVFKLSLDNTEENKKKHWGFLGNVSEGYQLPKEWVTCPFNSCGCGADVVLSKAKTNDDRQMLAVTNWGDKGRDGTSADYRDTVKDPVAVETNFQVPYQILWDLGRFCNYDCNYCWSSVHNRTDPHKDYDDLIRVSDDIITNWAKGKQIRWNFGGGEPTLHPKFLDWMQYLKSRNQWTLVTTNGSRDTKYWKKLIPFLNSVNMSAHFSQVDEDRFIRNIEVICEYFDVHSDDHWLEIKLMAPPEYFDRALAMRERIQKLGVLDKPGAYGRIKGVMSLVPIRSLGDAGTIVEYSPEQLQILSNQ
jgi:MoaA/NifB/PqqE/SkfB family radical SAM enzyme